MADRSYPGSNSSGESDTLGGDRGERTRLADIPAHVNESISVSDMDREATDVEVGKGYQDGIGQDRDVLMEEFGKGYHDRDVRTGMCWWRN